jgi:hypothetical protein
VGEKERESGREREREREMTESQQRETRDNRTLKNVPPARLYFLKFPEPPKNIIISWGPSFQYMSLLEGYYVSK